MSRKQPSVRSSFGVDEAVSVSHSLTQSQPSRRCETRKRHSTVQKRQRTQEKRKSTEEYRQCTGEKSADRSSSVTDSDHEAPHPSAHVQEVPTQETEELDSRTHSKTFARAANLLREALELGDKGGVLFVDVTAESSRNAPLWDPKKSQCFAVLLLSPSYNFWPWIEQQMRCLCLQTKWWPRSVVPSFLPSYKMNYHEAL